MKGETETQRVRGRYFEGDQFIMRNNNNENILLSQADSQKWH